MKMTEALECLCGSQEFTLYRQGHYNFFLVDGVAPFFQALRCKSCGLVVTNPPPGEHIAYVNDSEVQKLDQESEVFVATSYYRLNKIQPFIRDDWNVLEIGCSSGKLVELIKQAGVARSVGVDLHLPSVEYAHKFGRNVIGKNLRNAVL
jgi:SAM-dependent methyltransferase